VDDIGKPMTDKELLAAIGWKHADVRHALRLVEIEEHGAHADLTSDIMRQHRQARKSASRAVLTRRRRGKSVGQIQQTVRRAYPCSRVIARAIGHERDRSPRGLPGFAV
jgi:hypothetical protein